RRHSRSALIVAAQLCKCAFLRSQITKAASRNWIRFYFHRVVGAPPEECRIESSATVIISPSNGGAGFAGKSGRKTANVCDANAMETITNTAAHFMSAALSKMKPYGKQNFFAITVISRPTRADQ